MIGFISGQTLPRAAKALAGGSPSSISPAAGDADEQLEPGRPPADWTHSPLASAWREFSVRHYAEVEKIIFELERREVGLLLAATNIGKTTLALNLAITRAAGRAFHPLAEAASDGRRVLLIDGETRQARYQRDITRMVLDLTDAERDLVGENLYVMCDALIERDPLDLANEGHMAAVLREARRCRADLIIVDTLSALFTVASENDNAEMTKRVMRPLDALARATGAAVLVLHHIGKQSEDARAGVDAYRGRGASALGGHARLVLLLTPDTKDERFVTLKCAKSKGDKFKPVLLRLDEGRWFAASSGGPSPKQSNYELVTATVTAFGRPVKRKEIIAELKGRVSPSDIDRQLNAAKEHGALVKVERGCWAVPGVIGGGPHVSTNYAEVGSAAN